uniref:Beta-glucosidase n=1 Tax=Anisakis simplex TaxID=6269 RepID=A0A0M3J804_ANISI
LDLVIQKGPILGLPWITGFGINGKIYDPFLRGRYTDKVDVVRLGIPTG